jgi:hypothetical protein
MLRVFHIAIALTLVGCSLARPPSSTDGATAQQANLAAAAAAQRATAKETFKTRASACTQKFQGQQNALMRAQCVNDAMNVLLPVVPYPDLLRTLMAYRLAVVEQYQSGKITLAQANAAIAQKVSELTSEEQIAFWRGKI